MNSSKQKVQINIDGKVFAPIYRSALKDKSRNLILYGGAGSGKSYFATQKVLYRVLTEKKQKFLVIRKVGNTLKDSVYNLFLETIENWGLSSLFHITKAPLEINCINGNKIIFKGLDDPEKIKSISGITNIFIEEASELNPDDFQQLQLRIRGKQLKNVQFILCFNPISEHSWLKKRFFDSEEPNTTIYHTTYLDNPFLDDAYIENLEHLKRIDVNYYNIYALGHWGSLGNLIFKNWTTKNLDEYDDEYFDNITYGQDFGYKDPNVIIKTGRKDNKIYVLDEFYKTEITNTDLIKEMEDRVNKSYEIFADSSEPARIRDIQREGFKIKSVKKGKDSIRHGIDFIKSHELIVNTRCTNTIKELQTYKWKEDKDGNVKDEPVDFMNHCIDSLRYSLENERLSRRPKNKKRTITKGMLGI